MKKVILTVAALALSASAAFGFTQATGGGYITGTPHDLSTKITYGSAEKQICVFCHTPHNALRNIPLWNRNDPTITLYYNTSVTLTSTAQAVGSFDKASISSFCMSCHDGVPSLGNIKNDPTGRGVTGQQGLTNGRIGTMGAAQAKVETILGSNMADDHPVGFDYEKARAEDAGKPGSDDRLHTMTYARGELQSNRIFFELRDVNNNIYARNQIECASCHKVHDDSIAPFLRQTNAMSRLCLACHNK